MLKKLTLTLLITAITLLPALAQTQLTQAETESVIAEMESFHPAEWTTCRLSGRLKSSLLPVSPSVKIYMERDKSLIVTLSVILMGEVGRIEIDGTTLTAVNKMKKVYCKRDLSELTDELPLTVGDIQALLLARMFLLKSGAVSAADAPQMLGYTCSEGGYAFVPKEQPANLGVNYGFETYDDASLYLTLVSTLDDSVSATAYYEYEQDSYSIDFVLKANLREREAKLTLDAPKWDVQLIDPFFPGKNYKSVGFAEFLKSF